MLGSRTNLIGDPHFTSGVYQKKSQGKNVHLQEICKRWFNILNNHICVIAYEYITF